MPYRFWGLLDSCLAAEELLVLARLDAGLERNSAEIVPLNLIIEEVVNRIQPIADKRGIKIIVEPLTHMIANIAPGSMDLILTNLLDNAVKFTPPGGCVTVRLAADRSEAVISVSDTGPGIKFDEQSKLFERFYRGFMARTNDVPGVGLGLALSQAVVRSHGGRIEVSNLPGGGAQFLVRIPLILKHSV
jgi:two-component system OmpR family sensor kinase